MEAPEDRVIRFGRYVLHPTDGLARSGRPVHVTHKALSVLRLLAGRAGHTVTKEEIFDTVWSGIAVSDAALTSCIRELRRVLKDDARKPRYIETCHRRGFRFLPSISPVPAPSIEGRHAAQAVPCVGRAASLEVLASAWQRAHEGARQVVVIQGEPGIGKTTLVERFLADVDKARAVVMRGACIQELGAGEPYRPVLDAVSRLCRGGDGEWIAALRQTAPSWLAQLPALQNGADQRTLQHRTLGVTRERMSRELTDFLESIAATRPLVFWIDDLHWSDVSTLDWVEAFVRRPDEARILLVMTARLEPEGMAEGLLARLQLKPWCRQIILDGLDAGAVRELVAARTGRSGPAAADFAARVHAITDGHPLFVTALLEDSGPGESMNDPVGLAVPDDLATASMAVPDRLRTFIEHQIARLLPADVERLEAAALVGQPEWSAAIVAAGVQEPLLAVERALAALAHRGVVVRRAGQGDWPDGTVAERFSFRHAIHRDVLRTRLPAARRIEIHRRIGVRLEQAFASNTSIVAAQLAGHFSEAGEVEKAIRYATEAAQTANRRGAVQEASEHIGRALRLLSRVQASADRDAREAELQMLLGATLMAARGWGAADVERAYQRASELSGRLESTPQRFPTFWGLWLFRWGRGELPAARELTATLDRIATSTSDPSLQLQAHHARWATAFCLGHFDEALVHTSSALDLCTEGAGGESSLAYGNHDAGVCARSFAARAHAAAGRSSAARDAMAAALAEARGLDHPFTHALAQVFAAATHQTLRDPAAALACAQEADAICARQGFPLLSAWARALIGWATSQLGEPSAGVRELEAAVRAAFATGSRQFQTLLLALLAEAQQSAGLTAAAIATLDDAFERMHVSGERFHEAELYRLKGHLLCAAAGPNGASDAAAAFEHGLTVGRRQGAHLLAFRCALALSRLRPSEGRLAEARLLLEKTAAAVPDAPPEDRKDVELWRVAPA